MCLGADSPAASPLLLENFGALQRSLTPSSSARGHCRLSSTSGACVAAADVRLR